MRFFICTYVLFTFLSLSHLFCLNQSYKWRFRLIRVSEANTYRRSLITLRMSSSDEGFDKKTNSVMINKEGEHMERGVFDAEIKGDIKMLVNIYIDAEKSNAEGFRSINPSLLLDNSHILTKGRLYENVIEELLQEEGALEEGRAPGSCCSASRAARSRAARRPSRRCTSAPLSSARSAA